MNNNYIYPNNSNLERTRSNMAIRPMYIDNYLNMSKGKRASFYLSFPNSKEWKDTILKGTIQDVGSDYTLIKDMTTGKIILIYNMYIDYIIFEN